MRRCTASSTTREILLTFTQIHSSQHLYLSHQHHGKQSFIRAESDLVIHQDSYSGELEWRVSAVTVSAHQLSTLLGHTNSGPQAGVGETTDYNTVIDRMILTAFASRLRSFKSIIYGTL